MGKWEIARYEQFSFSHTYFQKTCTADTLKAGLVWDRVKQQINPIFFFSSNTTADFFETACSWKSVKAKMSYETSNNADLNACNSRQSKIELQYTGTYLIPLP